MQCAGVRMLLGNCRRLIDQRRLCLGRGLWRLVGVRLAACGRIRKFAQSLQLIGPLKSGLDEELAPFRMRLAVDQRPACGRFHPRQARTATLPRAER